MGFNQSKYFSMLVGSKLDPPVSSVKVVPYTLETTGVYKLPPPGFNAINITDALYIDTYPLPSQKSYAYFFVLNSSSKLFNIQYNKASPSYPLSKGHSCAFYSDGNSWNIEKTFPYFLTSYTKETKIKHMLGKIPVIGCRDDLLFMFFIFLFIIFLIQLIKKCKKI
jgi:hypothetical protein